MLSFSMLTRVLGMLWWFQMVMVTVMALVTIMTTMARIEAMR